MRFNLHKRTMVGLLGLLFIQVQLLSASNFSVQEIESDANFPEGAEKGAMKFIGAENEEILADLFRTQGLPFDPDLVRNKGGAEIPYLV